MYKSKLEAKYDVSVLTCGSSLKSSCTYTCNKHGTTQEQRIDSMFKSLNCESCKKAISLERRKELFLKNAVELYGSRFVYDLTAFDTVDSYISFKDVLGNSYSQKARQHLITLPSTLLDERFYQFKQKLDSFKDLQYVSGFSGLRENVKISCNACNEVFERRASRVLETGCPFCSTQSKKKSTLTQEYFLTKVNTILPIYDYTNVVYKDTDTSVDVICKQHGVFQKTPKLLIQGFGCNSCRCNNKEVEILTYVQQLTKEKIDVNHRPKWLNRKELDLYIPSLNFAIEFNGSVFHHSSPAAKSYGKFAKDRMYHADKWKACFENNTVLLSIYDFYWNIPKKKEIYKSKIRHYLGLDDKIFARKCSVVEVDNKTAYEFYDEHHIEGSGFNYKNAKSLGLYYQDDLVMVATVGSFYKQGSKGFQSKLHRICTKQDTTVVGGLSKLVKHLKHLFGEFTYQITLATGASTLKNYQRDTEITPRYFWVCPRTLKYYHRNQTQKKLLEKNFKEKLLVNETETTYMEKLGYLKVYDNGIVNLKL